MNIDIVTNENIGSTVNQKTIKDIIDYQHKAYSKRFQEWKFFIYLFFFYIPMILQMLLVDEGSDLLMIFKYSCLVV